MSQLIQMRQRIKAIETIKKVTHAMRLISMSTHLQLKNKETALLTYKNALNEMFHEIKSAVPTWNNEHLSPEPSGKHLVIMVASQKGLCGAFNSALFHYFEKHTTNNDAAIITVGKRATDYISSKHAKNLIAEYNHFSSATLPTIVQELITLITTEKKPYASVTVVSNKAVSFFAQKPHAYQLIPFAPSATPQTEVQEAPATHEDYIWEQSPEAILEVLAHQCLHATLYQLLFESLTAEQAARFLSMDSSTRNAKTLLEAKRLQYNKLRQTKITKELTELVGSF